LLSGGEFRLHVLGVFQTGANLHGALFHRRDGGLDAEFLDDRQDDQEADRLDDDVFRLEPEALDDARLSAGVFGNGGE
jgi:hypothetical protein